MSFTVYVLPHTIAAVVLLALSFYSLRHRQIPMATPFAFLVLSAALWCIFYSLEICTLDFELKLFWAQARFIGLAPLSTLWLVVGIQHDGTIRWFRGARWLILAVVPVAVIILSLTSSHHTLFRHSYSLMQNAHFSLIFFKNGTLFWSYALYSYIMAIMTGVVLYRSFRGRNPIRRRQTALVISSIGLFIAIDILFQAGITPIKHYTLSPAALAVSGLLLSIAVFQYRILDLAPITRAMVMDGIADVILIADDTGRLIEFNRAAVETFGLDPASSTGMSIQAVHQLFTDMSRFEKGVSDAGINIKGADQNFEVSAKPVFFGEKHVVGTLLHLRNVTEHKRMEREIRHANAEMLDKIKKIESLQIQLRDQAIRDPLTGLYNRRYLDEIIDHDFSLAQRTGALSFVMIDMDSFKSVNDSYGHQAGDTMLKALAVLLTEKTRKSDVVCRYGGEEFLIMMNGVSGQLEYDLVENIRIAFESLTTRHDNIEIRVTLSAGVACYPDHGDEAWNIIRLADEAMYHAKSTGRNRVVMHQM